MYTHTHICVCLYVYVDVCVHSVCASVYVCECRYVCVSMCWVGRGFSRVCKVDGLVADCLESHGPVAEAIATQYLDAADEGVARRLVLVEQIAAQKDKVNLQSLLGTGHH